MVKCMRLVAVAGLGLLAACTRPVDDPLAVNSIYWGLAPMPDYRGPLPEVLFSAADTPAKQGLLYTAMVDAEVASQYAGRAVAAEDPMTARSALGEVVFALDPSAAPDWEAKSAGFARGWAGTGYGLQRSAADIADQIHDATDDGSPALTQYGVPAARCADNTRERADRLLQLSRQALDATTTQSQAQLQQIQELADQLNRGPAGAAAPTGADPDCGLEQARRYLERLTPQT
jgi:ElaB/YqjD/DUF883 family membrane-anchored ribosome-binding protein